MSKNAREAAAGYLFAAPAMLLFAVLVLGPLVATFALSFTRYDIITPLRFQGLANIRQFLADQRLGVIYRNTLTFVAVLVPLHLAAGLVLALAVSGLRSARTKYTFRTLVFFPVLVTTASVAVAWQYMFDVTFGLFNWVLGLLGLPPVPWLNSPSWVYVAVGLFSLWKFVGNSFLYYLIGLESIPVELYEAASLDGATGVRRFTHITLPLLTPTLFFIFVTLVIQVTQIFDEPYFITSGGPGDASRPVSLYIYEVAFHNHQLGYASTVAVSLFLIILATTMAQFRFSGRWVRYGGGD